MRSGFRALFFGALFSVGFVGCSCGEDPPPPKADSRPEFTPETFDFGGLCAGESLRQELTIENKGPGRLDASFSFEGEAAASFRAERDGEVLTELTVPGNGSEVIEIVYEPTGSAGAVEAWLVFRTNSTETPEAELFLSGFFSANPTAPRLSAAWELCREEEMCRNDDDPCCVNGPVPDQHQGAVTFGQVGVGQTAQIDLALESTGCAPVSITGVELDLGASGMPCDEGDVQVELPEGGLELPGTVEVAEERLAVTFEPSNACHFNGTLLLQTSDPDRPTIPFELAGEGVRGSLLVEKPAGEVVDFESVRKGEFRPIDIQLVNPGTDAVTVENIEIGGNHGEHFKLIRVEQCGAEVLDYPVEVASVHDTGDAPDCAARLVLVTHYEPQEGGEHGVAPDVARYRLEQGDGRVSIVPMRGSSLPVLKTYPSAFLRFGSPTETGCGDNYSCGDCVNMINPGCTEDSDCPEDQACLDGLCTGSGQNASEAVCSTSCGTAERSFRICNEGGANDLILSGITILDHEQNEGSPRDTDFDSDTFGEDIFSLDVGNCADGPLAPDACCEGSVHLLDNRGGGQILALLEIDSNAGEPVLLDLTKETAAITAPDVEGFEVTPHFRSVGTPVTIKAEALAEQGEVTRYAWEMIESPAQGSPQALPLGKIDPANPDANCPKAAPGWCYELQNDAGETCSTDGSDCTTLVMLPAINATYTVEVTVEGSVCGPPFAFRRPTTFIVNP